MSNFKAWADEAMTREFGQAFGTSRISYVSYGKAGAVIDTVLYFGSPDATIKLQNAATPGVGDIVLSVSDILQERAASTAYVTGQLIETSPPNSYIYRVTNGGTSASSAPTYPVSVGQTIADGTMSVKCLGKKHATTSVKLALSQAGLDTATGGAPLAIGKTINGGAAIAVWMRFTNSVPELYDALSYPTHDIQINDCAESAI